MMYDFNADDVFKMAEQMEKNGGDFYRSAAENTTDAAAKQTLLSLAAMEDGHLKTFSEMRAKLSEAETGQTVFDPQGEAAQYLKALVDTRVFFEKEIDVTSLENVFKAAMEAEKDSIVFYLGMKHMVPQNLGKSELDHIINEEMKHIKIISRELLKVKA